MIVSASKPPSRLVYVRFEGEVKQERFMFARADTAEEAAACLSQASTKVVLVEDSGISFTVVLAKSGARKAEVTP